MLPGVRVECPACTFSVVMRSEGELPDGINKVVEGAPWCPNCDVPMTPIGSVDMEAREKPGLAEGLSLAERLEKIREAQREVDDTKELWEDAKAEAASCRKAYDGRVESLGALINRLTAVPGPQEAALPLFDEPSREAKEPVDHVPDEALADA